MKFQHSFIDPVFRKSLASNLTYGGHAKEKKLEKDYYLYPANWDQLALTGADELVGKILPKAAYDILNPPPKETLEQEIHAPHITLAGASSNKIAKGAGAHQNEGPSQQIESSGTSLASFLTDLTGEEAPLIEYSAPLRGEPIG